MSTFLEKKKEAEAARDNFRKIHEHAVNTGRKAVAAQAKYMLELSDSQLLKRLERTSKTLS